MVMMQRVLSVVLMSLIAGCPAGQSIMIVNVSGHSVSLELNDRYVVIEQHNQLLVSDGYSVNFSEMPGYRDKPGQPEFELMLLNGGCRIYVPIDTSAIGDRYYGYVSGKPTITVVVFNNEVLLAPNNADVKTAKTNYEDTRGFLLLKKVETCDDLRPSSDKNI